MSINIQTEYGLKQIAGNTVSNIPLNHEWKLVGSATGRDQISLPSTFNELYIITRYLNVINIDNFAIIPYIICEDTSQPFRTANYGYMFSKEILYATTVYSDAIAHTGTQISSDYTTTVYYR